MIQRRHVIAVRLNCNFTGISSHSISKVKVGLIIGYILVVSCEINGSHTTPDNKITNAFAL